MIKSHKLKTYEHNHHRNNSRIRTKRLVKNKNNFDGSNKKIKNNCLVNLNLNIFRKRIIYVMNAKNMET